MMNSTDRQRAGMTAEPRSEFAFIEWLRRLTPSDPRVPLGIGDDAAVVDLPAGRRLVVTTDMLLEGSCFLLHEAGAERVGRKAVNVNLSDLAAMAAEPLALVVSLGLPRVGGREIGEGLYQGIRAAAAAFDCAIIGGDTNTWDGPLTISITMFGTTTERGAVTRAGAKPGDALFLTGPLGGSILGKHLDFTPRVREARRLQELGPIHALIDISDGFAADLHHLCSASGCGARIRAADLPISREAYRLAERTGRPPLEHALGDGEDFELILAVPAESADALFADAQAAGIALYHVGVCTSESVQLQFADRLEELPPLGYVHPLRPQPKP